MKKIVLQGNTALNEVRESFGRWYYSLNEPYGDLYDAEEIENSGRPYPGDTLVYVRGRDGKTFSPIAKKERTALGEPVYSRRKLYVPAVDFVTRTISILAWDPVVPDRIREIDMIGLEKAEDCCNLRLFTEPLTLSRQKNDVLHLLWPEDRRIHIGLHESFYMRDEDRLYLSSWEEDPDYREETIIRDLHTGEITERTAGDIVRRKNGELWHITPHES